MIALDPGYGFGKLDASLVEPVVGSEIMAHFEIIQDAEVRLASSPKEVVMPTGVLHEHCIYQVGLQRRVHGGDHGLVANEEITTATGYTNPAAVERVPHQFAK